MTSLFRAITSGGGKRSDNPLSFADWASYFTFNGLEYPYGILQQTLKGDREEIADSFCGLAQGAMKRNGVVFACMAVRAAVFSEARFQFQQMRGGKPGDLFGTPDLAPLEEPWDGATTGDLLARMMQHADLAGNAFVYRRRGQPKIRVLRPDWVTIVLGTTDPDLDELVSGDPRIDVIGYLFHPGGRTAGADPIVCLPEEIAHFAPTPDPEASFRGMSWLTPLIPEIRGDSAATAHKLKFFENGAQVNLVVTLGDMEEADFLKWVELFKEDHETTANAYRTLFLAAGAKAEALGSDLKQADFKTTQGAGETRIAAAAQTPPILVGLSEGLQSATYSNYQQARRRFADGTMRPLWRNAAGSLARIMLVPAGARLWYDDRDIPFLQEDLRDRAAVMVGQSSAARQLVDGGWDADAVVRAVVANDLSQLLGSHSGLVPVQLHPGDGSTTNGGGSDAAATAALAQMDALSNRDQGGAGHGS